MITGNTFGQKLIKALGIEGQNVRRIVIDCECNSFVKVFIERYLDTTNADEIVKDLADTEKTVQQVQNIEDVLPTFVKMPKK